MGAARCAFVCLFLAHGLLLLGLTRAGDATAGEPPELRLAHADPGQVAGYRAHLGTASGVYPWILDLGTHPSRRGEVIRIPLPFDPQPGLRLYVTVGAYDAKGREGPLSNEVLILPRGERGPDDGVADDGDGSGRVGDHPCASGQTEGCDDNCPLVPNGPGAGVCLSGPPGRIGRICFFSRQCGAGGYCDLAQQDSDDDGVGDACDNCILKANADQRDVGRDGYGAACDGDLDDDGLVTQADADTALSRSGASLGDASYDPDTDINGSGFIDLWDWYQVHESIGQPPGPSGLVCAGSGNTCYPAFCSVADGDQDGDGIGDACDNCVAVPNERQNDWDHNGYGDACDYDYNGNGVLDDGDLALLSNAFGKSVNDPGYGSRFDVDDNGVVDARDTAVITRYAPVAPGPSGLACAGTVPCP
jgi:hypothetical protein